MPAITFIQKTDIDFNEQLKVFAERIDDYATGLGVTPSEVNSIKADALYYNWVIKTALLYKNYAQALTLFKQSARKGTNKNIDLSFNPPPTPDSPPPAVKPNIQFRFSKLVKKIKSSKNYDKSVGAAMGIEAVRPHFDLDAGQPKLKVEVVGEIPIIKYKRGKYDGIQIWKNTGTGWTMFATATLPKDKDDSQLPTMGEAAIWKYKAIYIYKDQPVGHWSEEITVTVTRQVGE